MIQFFSVEMMRWGNVRQRYYTTRWQEEAMSKQNQSIVDASDLRKYRTELPNLYDDLDLTVYEARLLWHYKRVGRCIESTATTALKCKMSKGQVSESRHALAEKRTPQGARIINLSVSRYGTVGVEICDIWSENFATYAARKSKRSHSERTVHTVNATRSLCERKRSPGESKNKQVQERTSWKKEQQQHARAHVPRNRDVVDDVKLILESIGICGQNLATLSECVSPETARAWSEWIPNAPKSFTDTVGYTVKTLLRDSNSQPPNHATKQKKWWAPEYEKFVNK
jgi:hypothetical protein